MPIRFTQIHNGPPHDSNYGYSYAKRLIDITNRAYSDKFGHMFTSIVPCNIYGPNDNFHPTASHVIPGMIQRLYGIIHNQCDEKSEEERVFTVFGTGKPLRQFIYSYDLARLAIWVLRNYENIEPIILSVDEQDEVSIEYVARAIAKAFNFRGRIEFDTTKADGQLKKTASNKKLRSFLPDFKFTNFDEAIGTTVRWFNENQSILRK